MKPIVARREHQAAPSKHPVTRYRTCHACGQPDKGQASLTVRTTVGVAPVFTHPADGLVNVEGNAQADPADLRLSRPSDGAGSCRIGSERCSHVTAIARAQSAPNTDGASIEDEAIIQRPV